MNSLVLEAKTLALRTYAARELSSDHPTRVAFITELLGGTPKQIAAAWLHDCLEDGLLTYIEIVEAVGNDVADLVLRLSRFKPVTYPAYILKLSFDAEAALVKLADLIHNWSRSKNDPDRKGLARRYEAALPIMAATVGRPNPLTFPTVLEMRERVFASA
jgi:(p)ppGpp synthase/HD superfamily hydrolase